MDRLLTKTLAEIYLKQGHLHEAYEIFKTLAEKNPSDAALQGRVKELGQQLGLSSTAKPLTHKRIQHLERWLTSIRDRRKG